MGVLANARRLALKAQPLPGIAKLQRQGGNADVRFAAQRRAVTSASAVPQQVGVRGETVGQARRLEATRPVAHLERISLRGNRLRRRSSSGSIHSRASQRLALLASRSSLRQSSNPNASQKRCQCPSDVQPMNDWPPSLAVKTS